MKILKVSSLYPPNAIGGAEIVAKITADSLAERGHDVHVATLNPPKNGQQPAHVPGEPTVHPVSLANIYWPFSASRTSNSVSKLVWHSIDTNNLVMASRIKHLVATLHPDVVITHNIQGFSSAIFPAIKKTNTRLIHVIHDYSLLCVSTIMNRNGVNCKPIHERCKPCRAFTRPRWNHLASIDGVVGVSQSVLNMHIDHGLFSETPSTVIHNPLSAKLPIVDSPRVRSHDHPFTFGFLGRVTQTKGIEDLLQAASLLANEQPTFKLLIAGSADPDYVRSLQSRWPLSNVDYVGYVDPANFLSSLDALVFPSVGREALGMGVYEAFSQGVPVIGSNSGGISETIDDGINGLIFDVGQVERLAQHMRGLLTSGVLHSKLAQNALRKAPQYLAHHRADEYERFIDQIHATSHSS